MPTFRRSGARHSQRGLRVSLSDNEEAKVIAARYGAFDFDQAMAFLSQRRRQSKKLKSASDITMTRKQMRGRRAGGDLRYRGVAGSAATLSGVRAKRAMGGEHPLRNMATIGGNRRMAIINPIRPRVWWRWTP